VDGLADRLLVAGGYVAVRHAGLSEGAYTLQLDARGGNQTSFHRSRRKALSAGPEERTRGE